MSTGLSILAAVIGGVIVYLTLCVNERYGFRRYHWYIAVAIILAEMFLFLKLAGDHTPAELSRISTNFIILIITFVVSGEIFSRRK